MKMPDLRIPTDMPQEEMPDLLRYWYLGTSARRHMVLRRFAEVDAELDLRARAKVLDIGSAWGYNVMALSENDLDVVGMDLVIEQFGAGARIAKENKIDYTVLGADAAKLPFDSATFDNITMVETFEHVYEDDRGKMIDECYRVLKPGGRMVLSTPNYGSLVEGFKRLAVRFPWLQKRLPTMCYPAERVERTSYHPYRYHQPATPKQIGELFASSGFQVRKTKYFLFVLKNTPNPFFPLARLGERALEGTPVLRRLAATVCLVADKP